MYVVQGLKYTLVKIGERLGHLQKDNCNLTLKMEEFLSSLCVSLISLAECNLQHSTEQLKHSWWTYQSETLNYWSSYKKAHILANSSSYSLIWNPCNNSDPLIALFLRWTKHSPSEAYCCSISCQSFETQRPLCSQQPSATRPPSQTNPIHKVTRYLYVAF
jgi:hypothetical protein